MKRAYSPEANQFQKRRPSQARQTGRLKRPRCQVCQETFDTVLFTVNVRKGKAHPLCALFRAIGLEKLATTSGR